MEKYIINPYQKLSTVNKELYGAFSEHLGRCIYEGTFVGKNSDIPNTNGMRNDVVAALKRMGLPVLRWPGGCFADEYHWRDGIGAPETRKKMINTHWGGVVEDNSFGTHEFFELCSQIGCEAYITGNVGSGSVREMSEWVEYITFDGLSPMSELRKANGHADAWRLPFFGVGNENWGCGGNMRPEYYADEYRRYATYVRNYSDKNRVKKIACGANAWDFEWTDVLMKNARNHFDGISLHYYTVPGDWSHKGSATEFTPEEYYTTLSKAADMDELITRHSGIMDRYDAKKRIGLIVDEWGTWYDVEPGTNPGFLYQQNTMRDSMVAALTLNIFNKHSDRVKMANIAQTVNVLQSVILTDGERMLLTPTYYVFEMFKCHQGNTLLGSFITSDKIGCSERKVNKLFESATMNENGDIFATVVNTSAESNAEIKCTLADFDIKSVEADILTGEIDRHNTFDEPEKVKTVKFDGFKPENGCIFAELPPCSVVRFTIKGECRE